MESFGVSVLCCPVSNMLAEFPVDATILKSLLDFDGQLEGVWVQIIDDQDLWSLMHQRITGIIS